MSKEDIQPMIDDLVNRHAKKKSQDMYLGVPMDQYSKTELLAIISEIGEVQRLEQECSRRTIRFMSELTDRSR